MLKTLAHRIGMYLLSIGYLSEGVDAKDLVIHELRTINNRQFWEISALKIKLTKAKIQSYMLVMFK